jgi:hypothetical protein
MADGCCDEHGCSRKQPILLLPSGFVPGRWYVLTRYRIRSREDGPDVVEAEQKHALDEQTSSSLTRWRAVYERRHSDEEIALAWHDVTCPERQNCRDRHLHSRGHPLVTSGIVRGFLDRLAVTEEAGNG